MLVVLMAAAKYWHFNRTARFKMRKQLLETWNTFYLETSGDRSYNLYLNAGHFFKTSVI
jgi:hypothetical protein